MTEDEEISVSVLGEDAGRTVSRLEVCQIIEARMRETFELLRNEIRAAGVRQLPAGIILTGGASQLSGIAELGREVLEMPVRVAAPTGIGGLVDTLLTPGLQHRRRVAPVGSDDAGGRRADALRVGPGDGRHGPDPRRASEHLSLGGWLAGASPPPAESAAGDPGRFLDGHRELTVRTGSARGLADLTAACAAFLADIDAEDGLLSVFVPHATAGLVVVEVGAGSDDDLLDALDRLLPREDRLYRHRHGSPGHGADHVAPLLAPPSLTVPVLGGRRRSGRGSRSACSIRTRTTPTRTVRLSFLAG